MNRIVLGWQNRILTATLKANSEAAGLGASQLQNEQGSTATAWQTTAGVTTFPGATAYIDTGDTSATWAAVAVSRTNLTATAQIQAVVWPTTPGVGTPTTLLVSNVVQGQAVAVFPECQGRTMEIRVLDPGNPDGFVSVPLAYAGPVWSPEINWATDSATGWEDGRDEVTTRGGQEYTTLRWKRRTAVISLQALTAAEADTITTLDGVARSGNNVLFVPDPAQPSRSAIQGRLTPTSDLTFPSGPVLRGWRARMTERL